MDSENANVRVGLREGSRAGQRLKRLAEVMLEDEAAEEADVIAVPSR